MVLGYSAKEYIVSLLYSSTCVATWANVKAINQPDCYGGIPIWGESEELLDGDVTRTPRVNDGDACATYTVMMSKYGKAARACGYSIWEGLNRCTVYK